MCVCTCVCACVCVCVCACMRACVCVHTRTHVWRLLACLLACLTACLLACFACLFEHVSKISNIQQSSDGRNDPNTAFNIKRNDWDAKVNISSNSFLSHDHCVGQILVKDVACMVKTRTYFTGEMKCRQTRIHVKVQLRRTG